MEDSSLRRALGREHWRAGSAVEILSGSDRRWTIGWVLAEDGAGQNLSVIFQDEAAGLKYKTLSRKDSHLASVGTSLRRVPEHFDFVPTHGGEGPLLRRSTGKRYRTYEEAWSAYFAAYVQHQVQHVVPFPGQVGNGAVRGTASPAGAVPLLSAQPPPAGTQPAAGLADHEEIARLQQSLEEVSRERAQYIDHAGQLEAELQDRDLQIERLSMELCNMRIKLEEACSHRDQARGALSQAKHELKKLGGDCSFTGEASWQAEDAAAERDSEKPPISPNGSVSMMHGRPPQQGRTTLIRSHRRSQDKQVEIMVTVPRALSPEEAAAQVPPPPPQPAPPQTQRQPPHPQPVHARQQPQTQRQPHSGPAFNPGSRSMPSLAAAVTRMPSAPTQSVSVMPQAQRMTTMVTTHRPSAMAQHAHIQTTQGATSQQVAHLATPRLVAQSVVCVGYRQQ